ncbi:MAG: DASS family sodium-coupled anion symporter [Gammaproteobacteria bacterium]|nr:DASS family sodium-coupled anion symporter [Gammaproteobacteria bacterium]
MSNRRLLTLLLAITVGSLLYWGLALELPLRIGLSILATITILWVTETFHITITALLIPLLTVLSGTFTVVESLVNFAHPIIFLFLGGFALAAALKSQRLDRRIALLVMHLSRGRMELGVVLLFATTAFISMWISNTATTAMMLPLALGLLGNTPYRENRHTYWFVLLGIAYSANIGGIGTLVGSPPNAIAAAAVGINFAEWLMFGLPTVLVMFPLVVGVLWWLLRPDLGSLSENRAAVEPMQRAQWLTLLIFMMTVLLWLLSRPLSGLFNIDKGFDSMVAIGAIVMLTAVKVVRWKEIEQSADWGVLLLFGGGLTLSALLSTTGTSSFLAESITTLLDDAPLFLFLLAIAAFVVMLTEVASNTASSALLVPIFVSIAGAMGLSPTIMAVMIAISASCAFMLPVATPPNAIVFGSGYIPQRQMMRVGMVLNLLLSLLIASVVGLVI